MLELRNLTAGYGRRPVLFDLSLVVRQGEVVALIGSNGAGKTTTLRTITGLVKPFGGTVTLDGQAIGGLYTPLIVARGIAMVPEGRRVFASLSVEENLKVGAYSNWGRELPARLAEVYELFPRLRERRARPGSSLSGGEQQMLAIGRALMCSPRLLLLDEPSMGLAPMLVEQIFTRFADLKKLGITILVVEQNAMVALGVADRAYVLENGRIVLQGAAGDLRNNPEVRRAYLGV